MQDGVDPEQGYARTLLDMSHRMHNSARVLADELKLPDTSVKVAQASIGACLPLALTREHDRAARDFL